MVKEKKSSKGLLTILVIIIIAVVICAALFALKRFGIIGSDASKAVFCQSEDTISMIKDPSVRNPKKIEFAQTDDERAFIGTDDSKKYFYFWSHYDNDNFNGSVSVIPIAKITDDFKKDKEATIEIDDDITSFTCVDGGRGVYIVDGDELRYFDGRKKHDIAEGVSDFQVEGNIVVFEKYDSDSEESELFYTKLSSRPKIKSIDSEISIIYSKSANQLVYLKNGKGETYDLYTGSVNDGCEKVDDNTIFEGISDDNSIWYSVHSDKTLTLGDLADGEVDEFEKPKMSEFLNDSSEEEAFSDVESGDFESAKSDLVEYSNPDDTLFDETGDPYYRYYNAAGMYYYYNLNTDKWYYFSSEIYDEAVETWKNYDYFKTHFDEFKDVPLTDSLYNLYCYRDGKSKIVDKNVISIMYDKDVAFYVTVPEDGDYNKLPLSEVYKIYVDGGYSSLYNLEQYKGLLPVRYSIKGRKAQDFDAEVSYDKLSTVTVTSDLAKVYVEHDSNPKTGGCIIDEYEISDDKCKLSEAGIAKEGIYLGESEGSVFYLEDYNYETSVGDLFIRRNNKSELLAEDVNGFGSLFGFKDVAYGISGKLDDEYFKGSFAKFHRGKTKKLESGVEVSTLRAISSHMFLYQDGDNLYFTNGKSEPRRIADGVTEFMTVTSLEALNRFVD